MAYTPIALTIPQYDRTNLKNHWLKFYSAGTTTPLAMATDAAAGTLLAKCELDTQGFPITAGNARFIPFIDGDYDLWLFPTEAEADANDTINAIQFADNLNADQIDTTSLSKTIDTVAALRLETVIEGKLYNRIGHTIVGDHAPLGMIGKTTGGPYTDNNGTVIVPTGGDGSAAWVANPAIGGLDARLFGLVADGVTDDTSAMQSCLNALSLAGGGNCIVETAGDIYLASDLIVPNHCYIVANKVLADVRRGDFLDSVASKLLLSDAATIVLGVPGPASVSEVGIKGLTIWRKDAAWPQKEADVSLWTGIGVFLTGPGSAYTIDDCLILGFEYGVLADSVSNTEQLRMNRTTIDCLHPIDYRNSFGMPFLNQVHCYPVLSVEDGVATANDISRNFPAFYFATTGSWPKLDQCFSYGWDVGIALHDTHRATLINCGYDGDHSSTVNTSKTCVRVTGDCPTLGIVSGTYAAFDKFLVLNSTNANPSVSVQDALVDSGVAINYIEILARTNLLLGGNQFIGGAVGVRVSVDDEVTVTASNNLFRGITTAFQQTSAAYTTNNFKIGDNSYIAVTNIALNITSSLLPSIASTGTITIPKNNDMFNVTGVINIGTITLDGRSPGRTITLIIVNGLTILQGGTFNLRTGANTVFAAGSIARFTCDGTLWHEI